MLHPSKRSQNFIAIWLVSVLVMGMALLLSMSVYDPLADPDPALQRPGFIDAEQAPIAPKVTQDLPNPDRRAVIFFDRQIPKAEDLQKLKELQGSLKNTDIALVIDNSARQSASPLPIISDKNAHLARAYKLNQPNDGGYSVGYTVVDSNGLIRYPTLDPNYTGLLDEVLTIVKATP